MLMIIPNVIDVDICLSMTQRLTIFTTRLTAPTVVPEWPVNNMRLIEQLRWWAKECDRTNFGCQARLLLLEAAEALEKAPTIDAVPVVQYNDLRDDFIDYVCSGVPNPAPYCRNATEKCVDARGWCVNSECKGFAPRGERKE